MCGRGLQKLEETWNIQSPNSAPVLAPALLAQPLPNLPELGLNSICRVYGHHTLPSPAPAAAVWPWPTLHLLETLSDHQHKFLYWCSLCPQPGKDFPIFHAESARYKATQCKEKIRKARGNNGKLKSIKDSAIPPPPVLCDLEQDISLIWASSTQRGIGPGSRCSLLPMLPYKRQLGIVKEEAAPEFHCQFPVLDLSIIPQP